MWRRRPILRLFAFLNCVSFLTLGSAAGDKKKPPRHPVNINTANSAQLQEVPGIGPATAEKILKMRKVHGPFKSVDELLAIKGIGRKKLAKWRPYLTVGTPAALEPAAAGSARRIRHHNTWCVARGDSMRRGT
ncbi:MAG TPA: helix-hairpin-helix domain-containing protein [Candidatus Acidoferrum sp.]|nr:helix-hairpin-helix domain-containing protein [Candidatus Acidoferrum sp.]